MLRQHLTLLHYFHNDEGGNFLFWSLEQKHGAVHSGVSSLFRQVYI